MSITLVANTSVQQTAGTGTATTAAVNTTSAAGSCLVVIMTSRVAGGAITISDNQSNTYTALTDRAGGSASGRLYYCQNAATNASHTFSVAGTFTSASIAVLVFAGAATGGGQDQQNTNAANATTVTPGSITPAENAEVVVTGYAGVNTAGDGPIAINGGFAITNSLYLPNDFAVSAAYLIQTTATAANPTWSGLVTSGGSNVACIASFKQASGGGGTAIMGRTIQPDRYFDEYASFDYNNAVVVSGAQPGIIPGFPRKTFPAYENMTAAYEISDSILTFPSVYGVRTTGKPTRGGAGPAPSVGLALQRGGDSASS